MKQNPTRTGGANPVRSLASLYADQGSRNQALRDAVSGKKKEEKKDDGWGIIGSAYRFLKNLPGPPQIGLSGLPQEGPSGFDLTVEPFVQTARRTIGDVTAIPGVGNPSPSYTAEGIRQNGVALGTLGAVADYANYLPLIFKGAGVADDVMNSYKLARMDRELNPFPKVDIPSSYLDVAETNRLPARIPQPRPQPMAELPKPRSAYDTVRTGLAEDLAGVIAPKATVAGLDPFDGAMASRSRPPVASLAEAQVAASADRIGTVSRMPVDTLLSSEFAPIQPVSELFGGLPLADSTTRQSFQFPVYQIGNEKIAFGNSTLGRFNPEFAMNDVKIVDLNPFVITGLEKTSAEGRKFAELFFDAYQSFDNAQFETIGQVPALTYAASRGDKVALKELERLAALGKTKILNTQRLSQEQNLANLPNFDDPVVRSEFSNLYVETGKDSRRFFNIDDMFVVHQTDYKPKIDVNGNVILKPTADFISIDPDTGRPYIDAMTGKQLSQPDRGTVHFTINHLAKPHMFRALSETDTYLIVSPLRDVLKANPGSLDNLLSVDTFLTPKPGEGLVIPMTSGQYIKTDSANAFANVQKMLDDVGKTHNNSPDYKILPIYATEFYTNNPGMDSLIRKIALVDIPKNFKEYPYGVPSDLHMNTMQYMLENRTRLSGNLIPSNDYYLTNLAKGLSPNARLRIVDSNENKFTTGKIATMYEEDSGL